MELSVTNEQIAVVVAGVAFPLLLEYLPAGFVSWFHKMQPNQKKGFNLALVGATTLVIGFGSCALGGTCADPGQAGEIILTGLLALVTNQGVHRAIPHNK